MFNYVKLAHNVFQPQMVVDIEDFDRFEQVCMDLVTQAGFPLLEDDGVSEGWIEFMYEAQDMWEIAKNGFVYKAVRNKNAKNGRGVDWVLFTRANHPAFDY
jgi:hypothetical protein